MNDKLKKVVSAIVKDFLKKNKRNPKDDKELALFVQSQGGDKYIKRKTQEVLGGQTQEQELTPKQELTPEQKLKAAHGAKLNYFKSLKHKCAEDEELYYYKKGGSVGCGCKKKEDGGEMKPKKDCGGGAVAKFKMARKGTEIKKPQFKDLAARDSFYINVHGAEDLEATRPGSYKKNKDGKIQWTPDRTKAPYNKKKEEKKQPTYKNLNMSNKNGGKVVDEFKKARCGSKMKKHKDGGSLNGIPFYLEGTPKGGIEFQENLEPPTYGVFGELGRNLEQGSEQFRKIIGSPATLILLTGLGSGIVGTVGPTVRILKDAKTALGSKSGFRNAIRKISRNLNAKKGSPEFKWVKTSGDIKKGGAIDRSFNGMGRQTERMVNSASRSEGSGYNAQQMLNNNPIYQLARSNPESLGWKPYHTPANNLAYTTSNRVFERNRLIDKARDWRNWIFE